MGHKKIRNKKQEPIQKEIVNTAPLVVVTTGGSGGHIFPAEAICAALLETGFRVAFVTDKRGQAFHSLPGVRTYKLLSEAIARRSLFHKVMGAFKLFCGAGQALILLQKIKPAAVVGVGGYASFPAVLAAHLWGIPVILHEQNAVLGRANRILAKNTRLIATSFSPTKRIPSGMTQIRVGMPARPQILKKEHTPYPDTQGEFRLLIFGGSQGAGFFSKNFPRVLLNLPIDLQRRLVITQQARPEDKEMLEKTYAGQPFKQVTIRSFFDNMPELLSQSHLVICRGGASTITELEIIGRPAIIVPLPTAADNHQLENARQFCDDGAGWLITEHSFNVEKVTHRLTELMMNPEILKQAAVQAYSRAKPQAAVQVAAYVTDIIKGNKG